MTTPSSPVIVGRLAAVFGVKGWLKVFSHTQPRENIFQYPTWWIKTSDGWKSLDIDQSRVSGKDMVAHIKGIDDRDQARLYSQQDIFIEKAEMPSLPENEYYWHQLQGMTVTTVNGQNLGTVDSMMETGANDVMMVKGNANSIDLGQRLIPYIDQVVKRIDLETGQIEVDWDPDF